MDNRDIQIGQLIQAVATLNEEVKALRAMVGEMRTQMSKGKGFAMGALLAAGGIGASISQAVQSLFGK